MKAEERELGYLGVISSIIAPLEMLDVTQPSNNLILFLTLLTVEILMETFNFTFTMLILRQTSNYPCTNEARFELFTSKSQGQEEE